MPSLSSRRGAMVGVLVTATGGLFLGGVAGLVVIDDAGGPTAASTSTSTSSSTIGAGRSPTSTSSTSTESASMPPSTSATPGGAAVGSIGSTTSTTSTTATTRTATGGGGEQALARTGADSALAFGFGLALAGLALVGRSLRTRVSGPS